MPNHGRDSQTGQHLSNLRLSQLAEDDGYDLTANAVSDGFRPSVPDHANGTSTSTSAPQSTQPMRNFSMGFSQKTKDFDGLKRPSSISKPALAHDSLTLRNDGFHSSRGGQQSPSSSSNSSSQSDARAPGLSQPSHPYEMYSQRTHSSATVSTDPFNSQATLDGSRGPTHPYALYVQSTVDTEDSTSQSVPVGFNGLGTNYHRQLGPNGEESGDLVGPLEHMEELPPYTKYPQESYQPGLNIGRDASSNSNNPTTARVTGLNTTSPFRPIAGAGGIGLATRNPEFASTDDLSYSAARPPSQSSVASVESHHEINNAARGVAEKPTQGKWQRRAKKKVCGIVPYWALCLLFAGLVIMGVVMGAVIGSILSKHEAPPPPPHFDKKLPSSDNVAYMQAAPPFLQSLPTGEFGLPPMKEVPVQNACVNNSAQAEAWSCNMPFQWYSMNVSQVDGADPTCNYQMTMAPIDAKTSKYIWGSQLPEIPSLQRLSLVSDMAERSRGPAWFLEMQYNKTVLVRESALPVPSGAGKRDLEASGGPDSDIDKAQLLRKKSLTASQGDKVWICTWPNVRLQVFMYPNQTFASPVASTNSSDGPPPSPKQPYPKLTKFVELRPELSPDFVPATCTQYQMNQQGQDPTPILQNGQPITITIDEIRKGPNKSGITQRSLNPATQATSSLAARDFNLTPCSCISFSWSN